MHKFEELPNGSHKPILLVTLSNPYDPRGDTTVISEKLAQELQDRQEPLYYIADMSAVNISFSELVMGLSEAFRNPNSIYLNPKLKTYTVGSAELVRLGVEAARQQSQYGQAPVKLFLSVPEALAQIQVDMAENA